MLFVNPTQGLRLCSADKRFGIELQAQHIAQLLSQCQRASKHETGGVLIGRYSLNRSMAFVTEVTPAPEDSKHGPSWFDRGIKGLAKRLQTSWRQTGTFYLGEWHFHPGAVPNPSLVDSDQMAVIAESPLYACPEPILLIVGGVDKRWSIAGFVYEKGKRQTLSAGRA